MIEVIPDHLIRIVQRAGGGVGGEGEEKIPLTKGVEGVPKSYDELSTHIVTVKYADAAELAGILPKLGSRAAGVDAEITIWPGMIHVFQALAFYLKDSRKAIRDIGRFVERHIPR